MAAMAESAGRGIGVKPVSGYRSVGVSESSPLPRYPDTPLLRYTVSLVRPAITSLAGPPCCSGGRFAGSIIFLLLLSPLHAADETQKEAILRAAAMEGGRGVTTSEKTLFKQSIRSAKESVARDTLDVFYRDALDAYNLGRYDEALEYLNNIYAVDPHYEDVAALREKIFSIKEGRQIESKRGLLDDYMRKGNEARKAGRNVQAINYWKQALAINPSYKPALKKIAEVNRELGQQQYEEGYRNYKKRDYEQALDNWSNAIALDPALKERGLTMMMAKTQLALQKGQSSRLLARAKQLYEEKDLTEALKAYEQILLLEPRNTEARKMYARVKIELGKASYQSAKSAMSQKHYAAAINFWKESLNYGYEVENSKKGIKEAESKITASNKARVTPVNEKTSKDKPGSPPSGQEGPSTSTPAPVRRPADPVKASQHYRSGLAAIRNKNYHQAVQELELASQYDPDNEHIYVALQRAKQEKVAMDASR